MLTPQQIVAIGIRLLAIFLGIRCVYVLYLLLAFPGDHGMAGTFILTLATFIIALALWIFPLSVAQRIIPRTRYANRTRGNGFEIARIGACLIGLWYFAQALCNLLVFAWFAATQLSNALGAGTSRNLVVDLAELAVGVLLMRASAWFAVRICGQAADAPDLTPPAPSSEKPL